MAPIHPVMAISACFAGPLLNLLLGIGLSGTAILSKPDNPIYRIDFSATLLISGIGILILLLGLLIAVPANKYRLDRRTGTWLIVGYVGIMTANLVAVLTGIEH